MNEEAHLYQRRDVETHILPDGSCLLFDVATDKSYALNVAGALIWDYCDGEMTGAEVAKEMSELLPQYVDVATVTEELLNELIELGLVAPVPVEGGQLPDE